MKINKHITAILIFIIFLSACSSQMDNSVSENIDKNTEPSEVIAEEEEIIDDTLWREAYAGYIRTFLQEVINDEGFSYSLIYLDDNDVPELYFCSGTEAGGETVITYYDGNVIEQNLYRMGSRYIEKSGLIYSDNGHMGVNPVYITKLEEGVFSLIAEGSHNEKGAIDGNYELDENGYVIMEYEYEWNNATVSEVEFEANIDSIFDREKGVYPERMYSIEEMLSILDTGKWTSADHRYEFVEANITWSQAQEECKKKGGYLATITCPDEQEQIAMLMESEGKTDRMFFVGYRDTEWVEDDFYSARWINADGSYINVITLNYFSEYFAPDYDSSDPNWKEKMDYDCGIIKYYDSDKKIYLLTSLDDAKKSYPEAIGKIGYICEYD